MTDGRSSDGSERHRVDRRWAEQEFELYKRHNRPPRPYYMKCLRCGEMREIEGSLLRAEDAVRRHAGVHGGLKEEHAEIVATDAHGRELFRTHAIFKPEDEPQGCPECGAETDSDRVACSECGHIPDEDRLVADGGTDTSGRSRQPVSRVAAKLAHSDDVQRVEQKGPEKARIHLTNNGLRSGETTAIRLMGWRISAVCPRFNTVSIVRTDRYDHTETDRQGGDS